MKDLMHSDSLYGYCRVCGRPIEGANVQYSGTTANCLHCWTEGVDATERDPAVTAYEQIGEAEIAIDRDLDDYLHIPFDAVDKIVGGIPPGDVGILAAFMGGGKTTFITSSIQRWLRRKYRVYALPLESEPMTFRTNLACKALGLHAGMVLTGEYKRTLETSAWDALRSKLAAAIREQAKGEMCEQLFVSPTSRMDTKALTKAAEHAAKLKADVFLIDHIDHISSEGKSGHAESVAVVDRTLDLARDLGLKIIATSQLNFDGIRGGDKLAKYQFPQMQHLYMGGKKGQIAAWVGGLNRPLKFSLDKEVLAAARRGDIEEWKALEPNCMGFSAMKLRHFGERVSQRGYLGVENGCVTDLDPALLAQIEHGVYTKTAAAL